MPFVLDGVHPPHFEAIETLQEIKRSILVRCAQWKCTALLTIEIYENKPDIHAPWTGVVGFDIYL